MRSISVVSPPSKVRFGVRLNCLSFGGGPLDCNSLSALVWEPEALSKMFTSQAIGFVSSPYKDTSEIPKGLGAKHEADGVLKILPEFEPGLTDIEGFSHLVVIWEFDRSPKLELRGDELLGTPPSDNRPHGVFATRSPRRPNPIGLTTVELRRREGLELHVRGVDMLDGTPILDIKPYLSSVPSEKLRRGWLAEAETRQKKK
jgi:tRNA (adenine37-N6)-methyltransferase